jgi:outer membrane receptor protein involved in Fe transport
MQTRWGGEVRLNTLESTITTGERAIWNLAGFASNELLLGRWRLTAGLRVDDSTLTGVNVSPRLSVVWSPVERHQLRASFNTGYNDAHLLHHFGDFEASPGLRFRGNPELRAEQVRYGELGWAGGLTRWLRAFATAFAYRFTDWISLDPLAATAEGIPYGNNEALEAFGGEVGVDVAFRRLFSAYASYAFRSRGAVVYPYGISPHGSPRHKVGAGLRLELPGGPYLAADAQYFGPSEVARVAQVPDLANPYERTRLGDYLMSHVRIGYAFRSGLDLSLAATNALDDRTRHLPGAEAPARRIMTTLAYYR